jgi:DNA-binding NarL/FixJ family response regulator
MQIAEMFNKSARTIEGAIQRIYDKTDCKNRKDLHCYVQNNGWQGL